MHLLRKSIVTHFKMSNTLTVLTNMHSEGLVKTVSEIRKRYKDKTFWYR